MIFSSRLSISASVGFISDAMYSFACCFFPSRLNLSLTTDNDKPMLTLMISKNLVKDHNLNAGQIVREAAKLIQGGGGGAPHFATAGGHNLDGLNAALDKALEVAGI